MLITEESEGGDDQFSATGLAMTEKEEKNQLLAMFEQQSQVSVVFGRWKRQNYEKFY